MFIIASVIYMARRLNWKYIAALLHEIKERLYLMTMYLKIVLINELS